MSRVVVHVGLPKTGTTWIQGLLSQHRSQLAAAGVNYPRGRPGLMFRGAVDVRGSREKFGLTADQVEGAWVELCAAAARHPGTTVLGHEVLAGATEAQIGRALMDLRDHEVHVVVSARDLGRQAVAHWQEEVKLGDTRSFADLERQELRADTGRDAGPDAGGRRPHFWHAQDAADALRRWATAMPTDRVHLVACPRPGAEPVALWRRFADAAGIDATVVDAAAHAPSNPSLGASEIALLREVNRRVGDLLAPAERLRVVKRGYAEGVLAARDSARPMTPASLEGLLDEVTAAWRAEILAAGYPVHGSLDDLEPVVGTAGAPPPDVPPPSDIDVEAVVRDLLDAGGAKAVSRWRRGRRAESRPR